MRLLPSDFQLERKQGFCVPLREWFQSYLSDLLADAMSDKRVRIYLDTLYLKKLISTHKKGQLDNSPKLWSALVFSLWARNYL